MMDFNKLKGEGLRRFIAIISVAVTVYYLYWRVTETFNPNALWFSWLLYLAECFGFFTTLLFFFGVWKPITRTAPPPLEGRTVDVLIPTKSESISIVRKTLLACNDLKYPHRTLVLDDGEREEVKKLCEELGCVYIARTSHEDAKAGNLNHALEHTEAEFIAVFDADHAPLPHFIDRLIGYFKDDKVAFAQAPQEFYNVDSFQHRVDRKKKYIWGEQYLFFSLIQPGRDHWNAAYFVGSCTLIRRKAIDDIGGFATESITEDMLTSIRIHQNGWSSVYHNENLAFGIAAETIQPFHIQRRRWGIGGWQVFFKANPLFVRGLSFSQRICYLGSLIYPIEGFQKLIFYATPPIALFTGILPMRALDIVYLLHFIPYFTISLFAFNEMSRGYGGHIMLEQFSMGKFTTYISSLFGFLFSKRSKKFQVTPKGMPSAAPYEYLFPQIIVFCISITAIAWALVHLLLQLRHDEFIVAVNSLWALYNSGLGLAFYLYARRKLYQRRESFRIPDALPVLYTHSSNGEKVRRFAVADNLTKDGMSLFSIGEIPQAETLTIEIDLPGGEKIEIEGVKVHEKSIPVNGHMLCRSGLKFTKALIERQDTLSRYLSELSVSKFLFDYDTRYQTYIEKNLETAKGYRRRARRLDAYVPIYIPDNDKTYSLGTIRNVSASGLLITARSEFTPGDQIRITAVLDADIVQLRGEVARIYRYECDNFPEYLIGVQLNKPKARDLKNILRIAEKTGALYTE